MSSKTFLIVGTLLVLGLIGFLLFSQFDPDLSAETSTPAAGTATRSEPAPSSDDAKLRGLKIN